MVALLQAVPWWAWVLAIYVASVFVLLTAVFHAAAEQDPPER
jgi:hypothetical protein